MILGMIASPVMLRVIKSIRQKRKINKLLREGANDRLEQKNVDNNDNQNSRIRWWCVDNLMLLFSYQGGAQGNYLTIISKLDWMFKVKVRDIGVKQW